MTQDRAQGFLAAAAELGARRPAGDVPRRPGHAVRRAGRPGALRPGVPRVLRRPRRAAAAAAGAAVGAGVLRAARRRRRPATATPTDEEVVRAMASDARGAAAPRRRVAVGGREAPARRHVRDPAAAPAGPPYRPAPALAPRPGRRLAHPARLAAPDGRAGRDRLAAPRRPAAAGGAAGRRVRLDERVRRRAAAPRAPVHPGRPATSGGVVETFTVGTRLTHLTRAMRIARPRAGAGRRRRDGAGLVGRHPARRDAAVLPRPLGPARHGPRCGRRRVQRRLGARRPDAARRADGPARGGSRTGSCGSTRTAARAGYEPVQQGVLAALPHCDDFVAGHSLATFAELSEVISRA